MSELLPLTKADMDFGRRLISIARRLSEGEHGAPKPKRSRRAVPLSPQTAQTVSSRMATAPAATLLFARLDGSLLSRSSLYHAVRRAGEKAGIGWPVGLHALRHSYATIMHLGGVPKEQIRNALGHHSWDFTESVYVHDESVPDAGVLAELGRASARTRSEQTEVALGSSGHAVATDARMRRACCGRSVLSGGASCACSCCVP